MVFVTALVGWCYYVFISEVTFGIVTDILQRIVYLALSSTLLAFFIWSYVQTVMTPIAKVPSKFELPKEVRDDLDAAINESDYREIIECFVTNNRIPVLNRDWNGGPRFCVKCLCIKPDRAHHCSVCKRCVLKFDHHCPYVNTCINYANYKFYVLFLVYGFYLCVFGFFSILPYFISFWQDGSITQANFGRINVFFIFLISGSFGISISCLFFYHLYLISKNQTTAESSRAPIFPYGPDKKGYDLGLRRNFREIFGSQPLLWLLPIFTSRGNGTTFPCGAISPDPFLFDSKCTKACPIKCE